MISSGSGNEGRVRASGSGKARDGRPFANPLKSNSLYELGSDIMQVFPRHGTRFLVFCTDETDDEDGRVLCTGLLEIVAR